MLSAAEEADRLRALLSLMREFGVTKLVTTDGVQLERPPVSPLEAALASNRGAREPVDDDESTDADDARERSLKQEWSSYWQRIGLSSGAAVPAFPGTEKAQRFLSRAP